jgi:protein-S-isoprenylcysteine O-methyltransferase Ste14
MSSNGTERVRAAALVALQFVLLAALVVEPSGSWSPRSALTVIVAAAFLVVGLVIATWGLVGLGPALTASPIPKERSALVTNGLYGVVRNPIYTGIMIMGVGLVVFGASWWHLATWAALIVLFAFKARWEERMLASAHEEFAEYAQRVGRFLPLVGRWQATRPPEAKA